MPLQATLCRAQAACVPHRLSSRRLARLACKRCACSSGGSGGSLLNKLRAHAGQPRPIVSTKQGNMCQLTCVVDPEGDECHSAERSSTHFPRPCGEEWVTCGKDSHAKVEGKKIVINVLLKQNRPVLPRQVSTCTKSFVKLLVTVQRCTTSKNISKISCRAAVRPNPSPRAPPEQHDALW